MDHIGYVGLGTMGSRIVKRLLDAGLTVSGYNRTRAKADSLIEAGMYWRDTPREVAETADVTFSMVNDTASLEGVTAGPDGIVAGLSGGKVYVDMTTVSPTFIRGLAERVNRAGADFLDAPVSGSVSAAEGGTLVPFVGGDEAVLERVRPIFALFSQKIVHMGANGQGVAMKVAINVNLGAQLVSLAECVLLADRAGIPREKALEALLNSVAASPFLKYKGPAALNLPKEVWFSLTMYQKDLRLALDYGRELGVPLFNTSVCNDLATIGRANGMSDQDFAALFSVVEMLAGAKSG